MVEAKKTQSRKGPRRDLMEGEIIAGAAKVFEKKGIGSSTLQDVADHLSIGRPSLYHYFPSKAALLKRLIDDLIVSTEAALGRAAERDDGKASAPDRLRLVLVALLEPIAEFPSRFRIMLSPEATPDEETAERAADTRRSFHSLVQTIIEEGVKGGEFRSVDPRVATFMALGAINWVAWWYRPELGISVEQLADELVELILVGIAVPSLEPVNVSDLHRRITTDMTRLGSMMGVGD